MRKVVLFLLTPFFIFGGCCGDDFSYSIFYPLEIEASLVQINGFETRYNYDSSRSYPVYDTAKLIFGDTLKYDEVGLLFSISDFDEVTRQSAANFGLVSGAFACSPPDDQYETFISELTIIDNITGEEVSEKLKFSLNYSGLLSRSSIVGISIIPNEVNLAFLSVPPEELKPLDWQLQIRFQHEPDVIYTASVKGVSITP